MTPSLAVPAQRLVATAIFVAIVAAACGTTPTPTPPPAGSSPTPGPSVGPSGTLTVALSADAESMDPHRVYQKAGISIVEALFDTLIAIDRGDRSKFLPGLAESWTTAPEAIEFTLRSGVTFSNGEPFDADAARFSILRVMDVDPTTGAPIEDDALKLNSDYKRSYGAVTSVEAVNPLTLRINLGRWDAGLIPALATLPIIAPNHAATVGNEGLKTQPIGTGPYLLEEWIPDDHATLVLNPDQWERPRGAALVDRVVFRPIPDVTTRISELTTGGVQIAQDIPVDQAAAVEAGGATIVAFDDARHTEIWLTADKGGQLATSGNATPAQLQAIEALSKVEVRTALNMAVDRNAYVDALFKGFATPMTQGFVPGDIAYLPAIQPWPFDPDRARQMLTDAGYPDGFEAEIDVCTCDAAIADLITAVQADLARIGVRTTIREAEVGAFNGAWASGATNPMRASRLSFLDPNIYGQFWLKGGGLLSRFADPEMDRFVDEQAAQMDPARRLEVLHKVAALTHDLAPAIFLVGFQSVYGVARTGVSGWQPHILGHISVLDTRVGG
ncbi:MAG: ABC transporter substrate-binding protein [Chloroflexota bacterium]